MTIPSSLKLLGIHKFVGPRARRLAWAAGLAWSAVVPAHADWTTFDLPALASSAPHYGAIAFAQLRDGRLVYGNNGQLYLQNNFGEAALTALATPSGYGVDPSFIVSLPTFLVFTPASPAKAVISVPPFIPYPIPPFFLASVMVGAGGFGNTSVYQFDPTASNITYTSIATLQNFAGAASSSDSLYVDGENGSGGNNAVSLVTTDDNGNGTTQLVIDDAGTFSAGLDVDANGNVFVADDDNDAIYEFTAAQLSAAIAANTTLTLANGRLVHQYTSDVVDKLAVDAYGRIWSTGFAGEGLYWWDPAQNEGGVLNPQGVTGYYQVGKFDVYGNHYVGYVWQAGFTAGDAVVYGYDLSSHLLPQPVINQQPFSESVSLWNKAQFQVSAAGDGPFTYTWMRNGHPVKDSGIILGARTRTLTLRSVTRANAGKYQVVVKNSAGRITSQVATLTIAPHGGFAHPLTP